jgi:hypothetical protein
MTRVDLLVVSDTISLDNGKETSRELVGLKVRGAGQTTGNRVDNGRSLARRCGGQGGLYRRKLLRWAPAAGNKALARVRGEHVEGVEDAFHLDDSLGPCVDLGGNVIQHGAAVLVRAAQNL